MKQERPEIKISRSQYQALSEIVNRAVDLLNSIEIDESAVPVPVKLSPQKPAELSSEERQDLLAQLRRAMAINGWTPEQARAYSKTFCGKSTVNDLNDSELSEIVKYLSEHTPNNEKVQRPCS